MPDASASALAEIDALRAFNRLYTQRIGVLDEHLHRSDWTLTEARLLFELSAEPRGVAAAELARRLGLDPAYLSRILQKFRQAGLVESRPSAEDRRRSDLSLTEAGRGAYAPLLALSREAVAELLAGLSDLDRAEMLNCAARMRALLAPASLGDAALRAPRPGDIGWIIHRHAALYAAEHGFDHRFEALVAQIAGRFLAEQAPERERCWVADQDGAVVGSIFLARAGESGNADENADESTNSGQLRLLYVEPSARGRGVGRKLLDAALGFAREAGYREIRLWTNDVLLPARKLYQSAGFALVEEAPHALFGPEMNGQIWRLPLV